MQKKNKYKHLLKNGEYMNHDVYFIITKEKTIIISLLLFLNTSFNIHLQKILFLQIFLYILIFKNISKTLNSLSVYWHDNNNDNSIIVIMISTIINRNWTQCNSYIIIQRLSKYQRQQCNGNSICNNKMNDYWLMDELSKY